MKKMKAAGYLRVSDQDQVEGYSLDSQSRAFFEACQQNGWEVFKVYIEEGHSAWVESGAERPAFRQMLNDVKNKMFDVLVTQHLDRLSRDSLVLQETFAIFVKSQVTYVCLQLPGVDPSTPDGRFVMNMFGNFAQFQSDVLSSHTKKGMKERAMQGLFNGEPPFGYERCDSTCIGRDEAHTGCHVDWAKAEKVIIVFERYAAGTDSNATLAAWMNDQGFRTNSKRPVSILGEVIATEGRRFTNYSIRDILKNAFYAGKVRHLDELYDGKHQAIISHPLFDAVQARLEKNRSNNGVGASHRNENPHLLTGLLQCDECSIRLWSQRQGRNSGTYYKVPDKGLPFLCPHIGKSCLGRVYDEQVEMLFSKLTLKEEWISWVLEHYFQQSNTEVALRQRQEVERQRLRARKLYLEGELEEQKYEKMRDNADATLARIYVPELDDRAEAGKVLADFQTLWQSTSTARKNRMLCAMLQAIHVNLDTRLVTGLVPKDTFFVLIKAMAENENVTILRA